MEINPNPLSPPSVLALNNLTVSRADLAADPIKTREIFETINAIRQASFQQFFIF